MKPYLSLAIMTLFMMTTAAASLERLQMTCDTVPTSRGMHNPFMTLRDVYRCPYYNTIGLFTKLDQCIYTFKDFKGNVVGTVTLKAGEQTRATPTAMFWEMTRCNGGSAICGDFTEQEARIPVCGDSYTYYMRTCTRSMLFGGSFANYVCEV